MVDEIIEIFEKKTNKTNLLIFWIGTIIFALFFVFGNIQKNTTSMIIITFSLALLYFLFIYILRLKNMKELELKYKGLSCKKQQKELDKLKKKEIIKYLSKKKLLTKTKLEILSDLILNISYEKKVGLYFSLGFSYSLFLVVSSSFLGFLFNNEQSFDEAWKFFILLVKCIVIIFCFSFFISYYLYDFFNSKEKRLKRLSMLLKELIIEKCL